MLRVKPRKVQLLHEESSRTCQTSIRNGLKGKDFDSFKDFILQSFGSTIVGLR